ncbi:MAG: hypothetical protein WDN69_09595 [Aliidongia sp.]
MPDTKGADKPKLKPSRSFWSSTVSDACNGLPQGVGVAVFQHEAEDVAIEAADQISMWVGLEQAGGELAQQLVPNSSPRPVA